MLTLNEAKCYKLWHLLNKKLKISIRTGAGTTDPVKVEGVVGHCTTSASLVTQLNIDTGVNSYFHSSRDKAFYGTACLQPILFMDDCLRVADGVMEAQAGHVKLDCALKEKQLTFHKDKSVYMATVKASWLSPPWPGRPKQRQEYTS